MVDVSMVEFTVSRDVAEVLADWLWRNGASAVVEADATDSLFPEVVSLTADLPSDRVEELLADRVVDPALEFVLSARVVGDAVDDHLAAQTWRDFATPVECGRFVIVPEWLERSASALADDALPGDALPGDALPAVGLSAGVSAGSAPSEDPPSVAADDRRSLEQSVVHIRMEPGDAFGAGTHVTTRLALEAVGEVIRGGESVLDFGSGTGVLGVAAAMVGAGSVLAVDIDPEAVRVTRQVAELNGVGHLVSVELTGADSASIGSGSTGERFDVVFANVLIDVIVEHGSEVARVVAPGGTLVVTGILEEQRDRAVSALGGSPSGRSDGRAPFVVEDEVERDGWLRLVLRAGSADYGWPGTHTGAGG